MLRIGRPGRAGASGQAISFCSEEHRDDLREIERLLGKAIPVLHHSIKTAPPEIAEGGSYAKQVSAQSDQAARAAYKPATPQQQKGEFWRSRRKRSTRGWAGPRFKRRGR